MQNKNLNKEEQAFQDKINEADFNYQEADWQAVKGKMHGKGSTVSTGVVVKAATALLVTVGVVILLQQKFDTAVDQNKTVVESGEQIVVPEINKETKPTTEVISPVQEKSETSNKGVNQKQTNKQTANNIDESKKTTPKEDVVKNQPPVDRGQNNVSAQKENQQENVFTAFVRIKGEKCLGNEVVAYADCDERNKDLSYQWFLNGNKMASTKRKVNITLENTGNYLLHLKVFDSQNKLLSDIKNSFEVSDKPKIDFTYIDQKEALNDFEVIFKVEKEFNSNAVKWKINNKSVTLDKNASFNFKNPGVYTVELTQTNESACATTVKKPVIVESNFNPIINAFTPNGDGLNDQFIPLGFDDFDGSFKFTVYDLKGKVIYHTNETSEPWNGRLNNNGSTMPAGNYIWKVKIKKADKQRVFTDKIKLIETK